MRTWAKLVSIAALSSCLWACNDEMGDCESDLDCVDGLECTTDVCGMGNLCRNTPVDAACGAGEVCMVGVGCVPGSGDCSSNADCDDGVTCTNDVCGVGGVCMNMPIDSMCPMGEVCDAVMGCVTDTGCEAPSDCDDGIPCTSDTCGADRTCQNTPVNEMCDTAMMEQCVPGVGCQVVMPCMDDSDCQDGDFCNGREICNTEFGCEPPMEPRVCNDSDDCTMDRCDPMAMGTDGQMGACVFECDTTMSECMCPTPGPTCDGRFSLPGTTGNCGGLWTWDFQNVTFTNTAGAIQISGWTVTSSATVPPMADPGPACPDVDAMTGLSGDCNEEYRIQGTFTDDNTFTGTFTATFTGGLPLLLPDCSVCNMTVPINGTRI